MTDYDDAPEEVRAAVDELQRDIRATVEMIADTYALAEGEDMAWPAGSAGSAAGIAFDAGVEAGSAAAMIVLKQRGWLTVPDGSTGGDRTC